MLIIGGERIFKDVCFFGALISGFIITGLHLKDYEMLSHKFPVYVDVWKGLPMLVISSCQYTISAIAYATSDCVKSNRDTRLIRNSLLNTFSGFALGYLISWFITNFMIGFKYDLIVLHLIDIIILTKHSFHCIRNGHGNRPMNGTFGNQHYGRGAKWLMIGVSIIDSLATRVILYAIFYSLPLFN
jgi:hypothetical protein